MKIRKNTDLEKAVQELSLRPKKATRQPVKLRRTMALFQELLKDGPMESKKLFETVRTELSISGTTYEKAKKILRAESYNVGQKWMTRLPPSKAVSSDKKATESPVEPSTTPNPGRTKGRRIPKPQRATEDRKTARPQSGR